MVPLFANIYYIDNSDTTICRNSANGGTVLHPWLTIDYSLKQIKGGDTLRIKKGVYSNQYTLTIPNNVSGTKGKPTLIEAFNNEQVIISGPGVNGGRLAITGVSWLILRKIKVTHYNQGIFIQQGSHDCIFDSCEVYEVGQEAIHIKEHSHHITIENCKIHDTRKLDYNGEGIYAGTGSAGPVDTTNNIIIRNCKIYNTTDEAIEFKPGTFNCIAENNHIYNVSLQGVWGAIEINQHINGVQMAPHEPKHIVRNNIIHNVNCSGIRAGTGCTVYNNIIYGAGAYGIYVDNESTDSLTRYIFHNTVDMHSDSAIVTVKANAEIKNNLGPALHGNLPVNSSWFVNPKGTERDYRLVAGSAPVDSGTDLRFIVPMDINNIPRDNKPDMGAYEYKKPVPVKETPQTNKSGRSDLFLKHRWKKLSSIDGIAPTVNSTKMVVFSLFGQQLSLINFNGKFSMPSGMYISRR
jgi:hypothetical protein